MRRDENGASGVIPSNKPPPTDSGRTLPQETRKSMKNKAMRQKRRQSKPAGLSGMWRGHHAPLALILLTVAGLIAAPIVAQDAAPATLDAPFVDASHGRALHRVVEQWSQAGAVAGQRPAAIRVHRAMGLRITVRTQGYLLGYGDAFRADLDEYLTDPDAPRNAIDLVPLAERAAFAAFAASEQRLREAANDAALLARVRPDIQGAGRVPTLKELFNTLTIDIQIAHSPQPITLALSEPKDAVLARFIPGYHGLIADGPADKDQPDAWIVGWPATALSHNLTPIGQLRALAKERPDVAFHETDKFGRAGGPRLWRFENIHIVRSRAGLPARELTRGGTVLPRTALDQETLGERGQRIANFLLDRFIGQGTVRGTYLPSADRFDPELATLREAALAAFALAEHRATQARLNVADALGHRIAQRLDDLLVRAATDLDARQAPLQLQPDEAALLLLTRLSLRPPLVADDGQPEVPAERRPGADPLAKRFAAVLLEAVDDAGQVLRPTDDPEAAQRPASPAAAAIVSLALGKYALLHDDARALTVAGRVADALWEQGTVRGVNALPWLALAQDALRDAWIDADLLTPEQADARTATLVATFDALQDIQIIPRPGTPGDVLGGFDLLPAPPPAPPRPDWRTAPVLTGLAATMRLENSERQANLGRLLTAQAAARFLAQLMLDPADAYYVRAPELTLHGVRPALDDNTLSLTPSAMTLLAFDQLRLTLQQRVENARN